MTKKKSKKSTKKSKAVETESTTKQIDLSGLSISDLMALQNALPGIIEQAKLSEKALLREKIAAMAAESGFELSEIFDDSVDDSPENTKKKRKQIGFVKAKYHNPNDAEQTWSGRGRKPKWAEEFLQAGGTLKELLINSE